MYVITCTRILLKSSYKVPRDASFSISSSLYVPTYVTSCEYGIDFTPCYQPPPKRREHFQWRNKRCTTRGWLFGLWVNTKNKVSFCHNVEEIEERVKAAINLLKNGSCSSFFFPHLEAILDLCDSWDFLREKGVWLWRFWTFISKIV